MWCVAPWCSGGLLSRAAAHRLLQLYNSTDNTDDEQEHRRENEKPARGRTAMRAARAPRPAGSGISAGYAPGKRGTRYNSSLEDGKHAPGAILTHVYTKNFERAPQIRCVCGVALDTQHTLTETLVRHVHVQLQERRGRWGSTSCFTWAQGCSAHESVTQLTAGHSCEARRYQPSSAGRTI